MLVLQSIIRQITASVSFLPLLDEPCTFDMLVYTDNDIQALTSLVAYSHIHERPFTPPRANARVQAGSVANSALLRRARAGRFCACKRRSPSRCLRNAGANGVGGRTRKYQYTKQGTSFRATCHDHQPHTRAHSQGDIGAKLTNYKQ